MNFLDRVLREIAPVTALKRAQARRALDVTMDYAAVKKGSGSRYEWSRSGRRGGDADTVGAARGQLHELTLEAIRNTPLAKRGRQVIASNVVGDGIIPKIITDSKRQRKELLALIHEHLDTTQIDANGRLNLYGLQRLAINTVVASGEVLIRRRRRLKSDGLALPFQIEVLEPEHLNTWMDGPTAIGTYVRDGIEYNQIGRRLAYHLFDHHPGSRRASYDMRNMSRRVDATEILHVFDQDRPGQMRGVSWFAPVLLKLQDLADYDEAELYKQKIASCFTAFRHATDMVTPAGLDPEDPEYSDATTLGPGRIEILPPGEEVTFAQPPKVDGYAPFTKTVHRLVAAGLGITYESLTGDLEGVNFSSGRMGRLEMDRNVSSWQFLLMVPQMLQPIGRWTLEAWDMKTMTTHAGVALDWVPPPRMIIDPAKEIEAMAAEVRNGFASRSSKVRQLGYDPEVVDEEIEADNKTADEKKFTFDTDPRRGAKAGAPANNTTPPGETPADDEDEEPADGRE